MVEGALDSKRSLYPFSEDRIPWWPVDMPWSSASPRRLSWRRRACASKHVCPCATAVQRIRVWKITAALDALSGGRLILGIGVGWFAEKIEAFGYRFQTCGQRTNKMIEVLRECWTE